MPTVVDYPNGANQNTPTSAIFGTAMLYKEIAPVPLPAALPLLAASLYGLGAARRRRRKT